MESRLAVLLHIIPWDRKVSEPVRIADGIQYCVTEGSCVWELYERLCVNHGIDQGEPYMFTTYFDIDAQKHSRELFTLESPYDLVPRLCNMIALCSPRLIGMARVIWSYDDYKTGCETSIIFNYTEQSRQITWHSGFLLEEDVQYSHLLQEYWSLETSLWKGRVQSSRLANALIYFYYAWRAYHAEQACINLSIVLESLFGPSSTTELSHQIAFNVSRFFGRTKEIRESIYRTLKKFYGIRSRLIHGEQAKEHDLLDVVEDVFPICATALRNILTQREVFMNFNNKASRQKMLDNWLFE
jgi:hypothetical protein